MIPPQSYKYWAFISYCHRDKKWGKWLHEALETYRVPKEMVGKQTGRGYDVPNGLYPIYRDKEESPTSADLGQVIQNSLEKSRYLIVICSPHSAHSRWVNEEVRSFKKLGRQNRILGIIVDGEPNASDGKPGFPKEAECFPEALRYNVGPDGELTNERVEPICSDVREGCDGKRDALLRLLSGLLGVGFEELRHRDEARHRLARILWSTAAVTLLLLVSSLAIFSFVQWRQAVAQEQRALHNLSQSDFLQAQRMVTEGRNGDALPYLERSLSSNPHNHASLTRLVTLLTGHTWMLPHLILKHDDKVWVAQFSPDGEQIVTGSYDGTARVWDAKSGGPLTRPLTHQSFVCSVQFSPDGKRVVTGSYDGTARIWDAKTGKPLTRHMCHDDRVLCAQFSPDGSRIVTASADHTARVWDAQSGQELTKPLKHDNIVLWAQFSPDRNRIVTASWDKSARVWDAQSGEAITQPLVHGALVNSAQFTADSRRVLTDSWDGTARVWDAQSGELLVGPLRHAAGVLSAQLSPDDKRIVTGSYDRTARVWDAQTGQHLTEPLLHDGTVLTAAFSPDGQRLLTASADDAVRLWDAQKGVLLAEPLKLSHMMNSAQFSPDGKRILTASDDHSAYLWIDLSKSSLALPLQHDGVVTYGQFSPDGRKVVTISTDNTAHIWNAKTGRHIVGLSHASPTFATGGSRIAGIPVNIGIF